MRKSENLFLCYHMKTHSVQKYITGKPVLCILETVSDQNILIEFEFSFTDMSLCKRTTNNTSWHLRMCYVHVYYNQNAVYIIIIFNRALDTTLSIKYKIQLIFLSVNIFF